MHVKIGYLARLRLLNGITALADLALMNLSLMFALCFFPHVFSPNSVDHPATMFLSWNIAYLLSILLLPPNGSHGLLGFHDLFLNCIRTGLVLALLHHAIICCSDLPVPSAWQLVLICLVVPPWLFTSRLLTMRLVRRLSDERRVVFVGDSPTLRTLRRTMERDRMSRTVILGSFTEAHDALSSLPDLDCQELYCRAEISPEDFQSLSGHCENTLIRLYLVPNSQVFNNRRTVLTFEGDIPVLATCAEPLRDVTNLILKRTFDIVFAGAFLLTVFPFASLVIGAIIKLRSPGPVFFLQRRNGLNGKDFTCIKFRTMRADPSCDGKAATGNDSRKFPFGDFLRRHNLDELPQFVNVFIGNMSLVGPRPHATWTTHAYKDLVNKYMMRLYAKPGITGWAQVTGCRGETKTTDDMVRRIHLDIWYINHWSLALDLRIIWLTVRNMLGRDKGNAY